jgi:hypothetical protein
MTYDTLALEDKVELIPKEQLDQQKQAMSEYFNNNNPNSIAFRFKEQFRYCVKQIKQRMNSFSRVMDSPYNYNVPTLEESKQYKRYLSNLPSNGGVVAVSNDKLAAVSEILQRAVSIKSKWKSLQPSINGKPGEFKPIAVYPRSAIAGLGENAQVVADVGTLSNQSKKQTYIWYGKTLIDQAINLFGENECENCVNEGEKVPVSAATTAAITVKFTPWVIMKKQGQFDFPGLYLKDFTLDLSGESDWRGLTLDFAAPKIMDPAQTVYGINQAVFPKRNGSQNLTYEAEDFIRYVRDQHNGEIYIVAAPMQFNLSLKGWFESFHVAGTITVRGDGKIQTQFSEGPDNTLKIREF